MISVTSVDRLPPDWNDAGQEIEDAAEQLRLSKKETRLVVLAI